MLSRRNRIGDSEMIGRLAKMGMIHRGNLLLFRYRKGGDASRFAVNISKKIDKRAVVRNRLRRQIHEALRLSLPSLGANFDVLISAKSSVAQRNPTFEELNQDIVAFINTLNTHAK
ncbi:ribonuclease P protein component [Candidatus Peregrinibacteria bacterium]|nr:ribonuclease P protein component [Candidatus Peregrinibacteria bacterium]